LSVTGYVSKKAVKYWLANLAIIAITIIWLLPIIWMLLNSFRSSSEPFYSGILPSQYTLENYIESLFDQSVSRAFRNSFIVAGLAAILDVILAGLAAYGFSRYRFSGQNALQILLLVIRLFPAILLAITLFQVAGFLNVYDTFIPLIIVNAVINLPFAIWNLKTTFDALPIELEEASWMDGLTRVGGIVKILLPLMAPSIVATMAFIFLLGWNEYLFAVSFIRSAEKQLITVAIASNVGQYHINFVGLLANGMLASLPLLVVFIWMQRYIVSGLGAGAVRG
jgi:ABC-type glycerol-3-phosphate transport system permease component